MAQRPLGTTQLDVLQSLDSMHGGMWWYGCGWLWDTPSGTKRVLASLVPRGLVMVCGGRKRVYGIGGIRKVTIYKITPEGRKVANGG